MKYLKEETLMASKKMRIVKELLLDFSTKVIELEKEGKKDKITNLINSIAKKILKEEKKKDVDESKVPTNKKQYTKEEIRNLFAPLIEQEKRNNAKKRRGRK